MRVVGALPLQPVEPAQPIAGMQITATQHVGPIPDPATIEHYDRIVPGAANRMIAMAERDQTAFIASHVRRQWLEFAFKVLGVVGLGAILWTVVYLADHGHEAVAGGVLTALGIGTITAIVNARMEQPKPPDSAD